MTQGSQENPPPPLAYAAGSALAAHLVAAHMDEAEAKAWDSLRRYKFMQFGYWAAIWVHLNRLSGLKRGNPWKRIVLAARDRDTQNALAQQPPNKDV